MSTTPQKSLAQVILKKGRDGPVRGMNPWIFSHAIERTEPAQQQPGEPVEVKDHRGDLLGVGYYHPATTIAVRMLSFGTQTDLAAIIASRIDQALKLRQRVVGADTTCMRLINGDGDGLSGLVVDRYADVLVMQLLTAGMERMREEVVRLLCKALTPRSIVERSAGSVRREEGLEDRAGLIAGKAVDDVIATENGFKIAVAPGRGQKTGYFLDQRENRRRFRTLAHDARVLDAYCYAGGFTIAALAGAAAKVPLSIRPLPHSNGRGATSNSTICPARRSNSSARIARVISPNARNNSTSLSTTRRPSRAAARTPRAPSVCISK